MFIIWRWEITNGIDGRCPNVIYAIIYPVVLPKRPVNVILPSLGWAAFIVKLLITTNKSWFGIYKPRSNVLKWTFTAKKKPASSNLLLFLHGKVSALLSEKAKNTSVFVNAHLNWCFSPFTLLTTQHSNVFLLVRGGIIIQIQKKFFSHSSKHSVPVSCTGDLTYLTRNKMHSLYVKNQEMNKIHNFRISNSTLSKFTKSKRSHVSKDERQVSSQQWQPVKTGGETRVYLSFLNSRNCHYKPSMSVYDNLIIWWVRQTLFHQITK